MHQLCTTVVYVRYLQELSAAAASCSMYGTAWGSSGSKKKAEVMFYKIYFQENALKSLRQLMLLVKFRRNTLQLSALRPTYSSSAWAELNSVSPNCCRSEVSTAGKIVHNNASNGTQTYSPAQKLEWWGLDRFSTCLAIKAAEFPRSRFQMDYNLFGRFGFLLGTKILSWCVWNPMTDQWTGNKHFF